MKVLMQKETANLFLATPWWEIPEPIMEETIPNAKFGVLIQVGWLIQNMHGVYFGVNSLNGFEELGDL